MLTREERENHACCLKRHLCKDEHYHERDVERIVAARVEGAWQEGHDSACEDFIGTCERIHPNPYRQPAHDPVEGSESASEDA